MRNPNSCDVYKRIAIYRLVHRVDEYLIVVAGYGVGELFGDAGAITILLDPILPPKTAYCQNGCGPTGGGIGVGRGGGVGRGLGVGEALPVSRCTGLKRPSAESDCARAIRSSFLRS